MKAQKAKRKKMKAQKTKMKGNQRPKGQNDELKPKRPKFGK